MLIAKNVIGTMAYMGGLMALPEQFCWSWGQLIQFSTEYLCLPNEIIHLAKSDTSYHSVARNILSEQFLGDWLLMLDTDHAFEPDLALRMVSLFEKYDLDVLSGLYHYKHPPHLPVIYLWDDKRRMLNAVAEWKPDAVLLEVTTAGAGCLLVRRRVFDRIRTELDEKPFDFQPPYSEDFSFFDRLRRLGIKSHCAPRVESYHLTVRRISSSDRNLEGVETYPVESVVQPILAAPAG